VKRNIQLLLSMSFAVLCVVWPTWGTESSQKAAVKKLGVVQYAGSTVTFRSSPKTYTVEIQDQGHLYSFTLFWNDKLLIYRLGEGKELRFNAQNRMVVWPEGTLATRDRFSPEFQEFRARFSTSELARELKPLLQKLSGLATVDRRVRLFTIPYSILTGEDILPPTAPLLATDEEFPCDQKCLDICDKAFDRCVDRGGDPENCFEYLVGCIRACCSQMDQ
jgi:hypothetical protein